MTDQPGHPTLLQMFTYHRLGLATGLVSLGELHAWVDAQILKTLAPQPELIELSLSGRLPVSQVLRLLNLYQGAPDTGVPFQLLFQQAARLLARDASSAPGIIRGLCLLLAEEYLTGGLRPQLVELQAGLNLYDSGQLPAQALHTRLNRFLLSNRT